MMEEARSLQGDSSPISEEKAEDVTQDSQPEAGPAPKPTGPAMPPGPVDHGLRCWLQVVASFAMWTNTWGIVNSFGVFQTYYEVIHLSNKSASQISWIGSIQAFLLITIGMLSGPLYDAGHFQALNVGGSFLVVFGLMMTSLCKEYWQAILAQSIVVGIGCGLLFIPATAIIPQFFVKRRALASGLAAGGSGFGGLIFPIVFRELQPSIGFGWAVRVIAFISLFFGIVSGVLGCNKLPPGKPRKLVDMDFFKHKPLVLVSSGAFFGFLGLYVPTYYIGVYALELGITGQTLAFYLVAIMQAGSLVGRIGPSLVADKIGPVNLALTSIILAGVLSFCWIAIKNTAGLIVFAILYGSAFGMFLGMAAPAFASLMRDDMKKFGTYMAMGFSMASPGILVGNPISGAILRSDSGFVGLQAFSGAVLLFGGCLMIASRWLAVGWSLERI